MSSQKARVGTIDLKLFNRIVGTLMGEDTVDVAKYLLENPDATDEEVADDLKLNVKVVRNALFKLNEQSLARFRRIRNADTGYFVYYWNLESGKVKDLIRRRGKKIVSILKQRLEYESDNLLYHCGNNECQPKALDAAYQANFVCGTCQQPLDQQDTAERTEFLEAVIEELQKSF
ncbi:MAG TPA: hypothetical protein VJ044_14070 [Candidatus Hodarchaeales archaeon]|nr:hypothetical protein [Candidatus Hodarchaeales archaeon]